MIRKSLLIIGLLFPFFTTAQFSFRIKAGTTFNSFLNNTHYEDYLRTEISQKSKIGIQAGIVGCYKYSDKIFFQAEMIYSQKGFLVSESELPPNTLGSPNRSFDITWHYIDFPLLLKSQLTKNLYLEFGPSVSYLFNADFEKKKFSMPQDYPKNQAQYYSRFDAALNTGLSFQLKEFEIGTRYSFSLTKLREKEEYFDPEFDYSALLPYGKHRLLQFFLSYKIEGKK